MLPVPSSQSPFRNLPSRARGVGAVRGWVAACLLVGSLAAAQVPSLLNYQGRVELNSETFNGTGFFKFALLDAEASRVYWRNAPDGNGDGIPDMPVSVPVTRGLFSVLLGDESLAHMAPLSSSVFENSSVYLRVWFSDGFSEFRQLDPDQRVAAVGYAFMAGNVSDGSVGPAQLAPGTLDAANISGTFDPSQIPGLDAGHLVSGRLADDRLPGSVDARFDALTLQIQALADQVRALGESGGTGGGSISVAGLIAVSTMADDVGLAARGFVPFSTLTASGWVTASVEGAPAARHGHSVVWNGTEMIVWGGRQGGSVYLASGGSYDPRGDRWSALSPVDAPAGRSGHSAVWTGTEMLVWGGYKIGTELSTGAAFNADRQRWTPLADADAPEGRYDHVTAWSGSQMVVWGGRNAGGILGDGATYDRPTDTWISLDLPGSPGGRFDAAAVWAGDRLIIWGGRGDAGFLADGAQLVWVDGRPDHWQAMTLADAPSPRANHSAIWTGAVVIVWGGEAETGSLKDGAVYDPVLDVWSPLPVSGAPSPRRNHHAFWTGSEMVLWGGRGASGLVADGAAFEPERNSWRPLSVSGGPLARAASGAVWTGSELLVFGGRNSLGQELASLQRLVPHPDWHFYRKP